MQFQLSSVISAVNVAEKIVSLFLTYNGTTHSIEFKHDALATPEDAKNTLTNAVITLLDAYIASKS